LLVQVSLYNVSSVLYKDGLQAVTFDYSEYSVCESYLHVTWGAVFSSFGHRFSLLRQSMAKAPWTHPTLFYFETRSQVFQAGLKLDEWLRQEDPVFKACLSHRINTRPVWAT